MTKTKTGERSRFYINKLFRHSLKDSAKVKIMYRCRISFVILILMQGLVVTAPLEAIDDKSHEPPDYPAIVRAYADKACERFARGLWDHQIGDHKTGDFSRHVTNGDTLMMSLLRLWKVQNRPKSKVALVFTDR
jgi:hypothetical protein